MFYSTLPRILHWLASAFTTAWLWAERRERETKDGKL